MTKADAKMNHIIERFICGDAFRTSENFNTQRIGYFVSCFPLIQEKKNARTLFQSFLFIYMAGFFLLIYVVALVLRHFLLIKFQTGIIRVFVYSKS